jgi:hypothetical protein
MLAGAAMAAAIAPNQNSLRREMSDNRTSSLMVFPRLSVITPLGGDGTRPEKFQQVGLRWVAHAEPSVQSQRRPRADASHLHLAPNVFEPAWG